MLTVLITLTTAGADTGNFSLYSDVSGYTVAFETGVAKSALEAGYVSSLVPTSTSVIRVKSEATCKNYIDIPVVETTTTTTTTTTIAPITQVLIYANDIGSLGANLQYTRNGGGPINVASVAGPICTYVGTITSANVSVGDTLVFSTSGIVYAINGQASAACPFASPSTCDYTVSVVLGTNNIGIKINSDGPCA